MQTMSKAVAIIPARWGSTRFPGKSLHPIHGKPLVQHVWERVCRAKSVDRVIIATDDMRIAEAAFAFGAEVSLTPSTLPTGTDRVARVAASLSGFPIVINVQGDEPLIRPGLINRLVRNLREDREVSMATAASPFTSESEALSPDNVKVVTALDGSALYFSRSLIPLVRDGDVSVRYLHHMGIYAFRRNFLLQFVKWKSTPLERAEKLEQLRALEHGAKIHVLVTKHRSPGVDRPADLALVEELL
jgi:3-deoxy-manno-octulosonate cytidylyltransferase (CMP-KDO synthetase)